MSGGALMYDGTEGSSGSDASHERAAREAASGAATDRQALILDGLGFAGGDGLTWREVATLTGLHHGQVTGSLSNMHKAGHVARLTDKRDRCSIYVLPEHVEGRATTVQGRTPSAPMALSYPYRNGPVNVLGPDVTVSLDGLFLTWNGRKYHPVDVHDASGRAPEDDQGRRPLFDL